MDSLYLRLFQIILFNEVAISEKPEQSRTTKNQFIKMKRIAIVLVMSLSVSFAFVGCGNSMENDADKLAKLYCNSINLIGEAFGSVDEDFSFDEKALKDLEKKGEEYEAEVEKILAKYSAEEGEELQKKAMSKMAEYCD